MNEKEKEDFLENLRMRLLRLHPFFGSLLHRTKMEVREGIPAIAMATPKNIVFRMPDFPKRTIDDQVFIFAHELLHIIFFHPHRFRKLSGKDKQRHQIANVAGDALINSFLKEMGLTLPADAIYDEDYTPDKYSLEELFYILLKQAQKKDGGGDSKMKLQWGDIDPDEETEEVSAVDEIEGESEIQGILEQAANMAREAGKGSAMLDRMIDKWKSPKIRWEQQLQDWADVKVKRDISWNRPHRRSHILNLYLPIRDGYEIGHLGVAIDLSGSISGPEVSIFLGNLQYIFDRCKPRKVTIVTFESQIVDVFEYEGEMPNVKDIKLRGGGGTDFRPVFKHFDKMKMELGDEFQGLIFMTDLYGPFPDKAPDYPVVFVAVDSTNLKAPFGEVIDGSQIKEAN